MNHNLPWALLVAAIAVSGPAVAQDPATTTQSLLVRLEANEGALVTGAYWALSGTRVETWCERRLIGNASAPPAVTEHWKFADQGDWPKRNRSLREHMVNVKFLLTPFPEPTNVVCFYKNIDERPGKKGRLFYPWAHSERRPDYVLHRRYFHYSGANDIADFQYRFYVSLHPPEDIP